MSEQLSSSTPEPEPEKKLSNEEAEMMGRKKNVKEMGAKASWADRYAVLFDAREKAKSAIESVALLTARKKAAENLLVQIDALKNNILEMENTLVDLGQDLHEKNEELKTIGAGKNTLKKECASLEKKYQSCFTDLKDLKREFRHHSPKEDVLTAELNETIEKIAKLKEHE